MSKVPSWTALLLLAASTPAWSIDILHCDPATTPGNYNVCYADSDDGARFVWSTTGPVTVPYLCPGSTCTFVCAIPNYGQQGYAKLDIYDSNNVLIFSAQKRVCKPCSHELPTGGCVDP
jgi:hypothetical protein